MIGNPQNILLGAMGGLDFWNFIAICAVPAMFSLVVVFVVVWLQWHRRIDSGVPALANPLPVVTHPLDRNQTIKGAVAILALLLLFLTPLPRETGALIIAALLLANRKITSRTMIATVDWPLLLLVACLFAITGALNRTGIAAQALAFLIDYGLLPSSLLLLTPFALVTSNAIGSLPASMLLLQIWQVPPSHVLYALSLLSSLSGNLLLSGSLTNVLIAERAERMGTRLSFADHARAGIPIVLASIGFAILWLSLIDILPLTPPPLAPTLPP